MDISKLDDKQFAQVYAQIIQKIKEDPIENFVKAQGFIDLDPTPAQEVILKVVFQKELDSTTKKLIRFEGRDTDNNFDLEDRMMTEVEIYEFLTETKYDSGNVKAAKINKINLICGRRSGKTLLSAIISIYCAISNNWKPFLKKTPFATVLIMSHSKDFSDEVLEVIRTMIETSPILSRLINREKKNSSSTMNLKVPFILGNRIENSRVQIKVAAASSKTVRGVAACAILCDEIAFWGLDETMKETDERIMKAVRPAMKQFKEYGMLIKLSSPAIRRGVLFNEYKKHREGTLPNTYAVFKAPSWMMNSPAILGTQDLKEEWLLDPDSFDVEYRANFMDSLSNFIRPDTIDKAVMPRIQFMAPDGKGIKYRAAIDAAFKSDAFTFTVSAYVNDRLKVYVSHGWKGSKAKPVSANAVAEYVRTTCKQFGIDHVAADQFAFQPLKEIFERYNVNLQEYTFNTNYKKKIYANLKKLFHNLQIDIPDNEILVRELKELVVEQTGTGNIRIGHPQGGSDDYADSLAISAFHATEDIGSGEFTLATSGPSQTYGIQTDNRGNAFSAPSVDMLVGSGHFAENVIDNTADFTKDPKTGKVVRVEKLEEDEENDDGPSFVF
jgi:hypothetical protein